ncbi:MAG: Dihydrofolate reductase [Gammaproteobacteria bacterium]|jgi:dihydrofolate reductase|nr:Dihydrofolate reductase [Gammaproteobacteria bacterium]
MLISIIAAMAEGRVIGLNNHMPWHLPADLRHFKALTIGKPVIMGRQTYLSLGKPLPERRNIVLTHDVNFIAPGCEVAHNWSAVEALCADCSEIMVIGGEAVYKQILPQAHRLYLTQIALATKGDRFFPQWNESEWQLVAEEAFAADEKNPHAYRFLEYRRIFK